MKNPSLTLLALFPSLLWAQSDGKRSTKTEYTDFDNDTLRLEQVEVSQSRGSRLKVAHVTSNTEIIGQQQLVRAACCNLGESFTTNPSVDVNYSDAATGARQIKLLGLSGTYVQMLTENVPNLRGAAIPFGLGYIPGPWMQSIQVSKGASSVRNGYESTTGQINIEYLKPQGVDGVSGNLYYDSRQMIEANVMAGTHLTDELSTSLLLHVNDGQMDHDGNGDGFMDMPKQRQYNGMWRWAYVSPRWISQFFIRGLDEETRSGMSQHHPSAAHQHEALYEIALDTRRYEVQWKNALILDPDHNASVALMLHGSWHDAESQFGTRSYDVLQKNGYAQLMYETDLTESHNLSVGASLNHDYYDEHFVQPQFNSYQGQSNLVDHTIDYEGNLFGRTSETIPGLYAQYTYKADELFTLIAGLRWDHSSLWGGFWTPRLHLKYSPTDWFSLRASAGKGYRTANAMPENVSLLASGRYLKSNPFTRQQEAAWNYGLSTSFTLPIGDKSLELNAEYYYTTFDRQLVVDVDTPQRASLPSSQTPDLHTIKFHQLEGESFSHTVQVDASYPILSGFDVTAGFRFSDARTNYEGRGLVWRPMTSRYKGMLSLSYKSPLELWQFDVTGQLNGPMRLYDNSRSPAFGQLSAQITREFHYFSIYLGGENLTNYKMPNPILHASEPWSNAFDATQVWGPTDGIKLYLGLRFKIEKY